MFDTLVKSPKGPFFVIPRYYRGIQYFQRITKNLDPVFQRGDGFLRNHQSLSLNDSHYLRDVKYYVRFFALLLNLWLLT
jgi:hypothetical protein